MRIKRVNGEDSRVGKFLDEEFSYYAKENNVDLKYSEFCFIAENDEGKIIGSITGRAYYNEVHIGDLIVDKEHRKCGTGSKLVAAVEKAYSGQGYDKLTLTTFGFQAPGFYKKLGFSIEYIREDKDPKLCKYFFSKPMI